MLLLLDDESGRPIVEKLQLDNAMAGAVLLELANTGRVSGATPEDGVKSDRLLVRDASPTGDSVLDTAIDRLETKPVKAKRAVELLAKGTREAILDRLVERGLLNREESKLLGFIPRTSWPAADSEHENQIRARLHAVLIDGEDPDLEIGSLISMLHAIKAVHKVVDGDRRQLKARAKEIAESSAWAGDAVRKAIESVQVAITTAVVVTAGAAGGGGGQ